MAKKMYPVQRHFPLILDGLPATSGLLRIDRALSGINHRLYRQSRLYHAKLDLDANVPDGTVVTVWAIADTWMSQKAYQTAYETFLENSKEERAQLNKSAARWNDFRVDSGLGLAFQNDLMPSGNLSPLDPSGIFGTGSNQEYQISEVHDAAGNQKTFAWSGSIANTFNIIDEYDAMGNTSTHPSTILSAVGYDGLSDELDDGQTSHLSNDGNLPPYNRTNIENTVWVKVATLTVKTGGVQKLSTGFFKAPSGMVAITSSIPFENGSTFLNCEIKGGDYKGVAAPTYLDEGRIFASSKTSSGASHNKRIR